MIGRVFSAAKCTQFKSSQTSGVFRQQQQQPQQPQQNRKKAAVILSGCGYLDGTDISEAVALNIQLSRLGIETKFFAPTNEIGECMNYTTKLADPGEERYPDKEAARIVRTKVHDVQELPSQADNFDVLFIPGGAGAVRNLSNFETEKYNLEYSAVEEPVVKSIKAFYRDQKPIGTTSLAGIIVASVLGTKNKGPGVQVSLGRAEKEHFDVVTKLGAKAVESSSVVLDEDNKIVSTGGNLNSPNVDPYDLYKSMVEFVNETVKLTKK